MASHKKTLRRLSHTFVFLPFIENLKDRSFYFFAFLSHTHNYMLGGSPGLVVMGGDSCSKGREFESLRHILDGHFFAFICCKNCNVCLKR